MPKGVNTRKHVEAARKFGQDVERAVTGAEIDEALRVATPQLARIDLRVSEADKTDMLLTAKRYGANSLDRTSGRTYRFCASIVCGSKA